MSLIVPQSLLDFLSGKEEKRLSFIFDCCATGFLMFLMPCVQLGLVVVGVAGFCAAENVLGLCMNAFPKTLGVKHFLTRCVAVISLWSSINMRDMKERTNS